MKTCQLQPARSLSAILQQIAFSFDFPVPRDLDDLWDALVEVDGPLELVWERPGTTRDALGEDYWLLLEVLADAVAERDDMILLLK